MKKANKAYAPLLPFIPKIVLGIGLLLMSFMIIEEGEPGALPLVMTIIGLIWLIVKRKKSRPTAK